MSDRRREVDKFFHSTIPQPALTLLNKYDVKYVYIGEMERAKYPVAALAKFENMASDGLVQVYPTAESMAANGDTPVGSYEDTRGE